MVYKAPPQFACIASSAGDTFGMQVELMGVEHERGHEGPQRRVHGSADLWNLVAQGHSRVGPEIYEQSPP
ncbi:hypothetical protein N7513_006087 [Penicillium frequentans]|nr:hypothetical protein N7513_006087 [Penicillium glabrum]